MIHVFLGPSLPVAEARRVLDARYLPPAAAGDVQALLEGANEPPTAIAIIDGYFQTKPAVYHKEILFALASGVAVYGASSMGALRAAELHELGMIGHGAIFEAFRSGALEDDDEVAVVHGSAADGYRPLSDAMVNLRAGLVEACDLGVIRPATREALEREAKDAFYPERSWHHLFAASRRLGLPAKEISDLEDFVRERRPDAKRADARSLLAHLATLAARPSPPSTVPFSASTRWLDLRDAVRSAAGYGASLSHGPPPALFGLYAQLFADPDRTLLRDALLGHLVAERTTLSSKPFDPEEVLASSDELRAHVVRHIPVVLGERGLLGEVREAVTEGWAAFGLHGAADDVSTALTRCHEDELLDFFAEATRAKRRELDELAATYRADPRDVLLALGLAHAASRAPRRVT